MFQRLFSILFYIEKLTDKILNLIIIKHNAFATCDEGIQTFLSSV